MDGTLLNRQKLVSEENASAYKRAMDKGIYVTIATECVPSAYFAKQLNMNCPVVSCNGESVTRFKYRKSICNHFSKDTIAELISICYPSGIFVVILAIQFMLTM